MEENDFNVGNLIALLRRQIRLIVICVLVVVGLTATVVFTLTPAYEATAKVLFDVRSKDLLDPSAGLNAPSSDITRLQTELEIMKSDAVLLKVIERQNLVRDAEFGPRLGTMDRLLAFLQISQPKLPTGEAALLHVLSNLRSATSGAQIGLSNLIGMSVRSESPQRAAEIANTWSEAYIEQQVTAKIDSAVNARNIVQARLSQSRTALVAAEESLDKYIDRNLGMIVGETGSADIATVGSSLSQLISRRNLESRQADEAEQSLAQRNWQMLTKTLQSDALAELERQRQQVSATLASAAEGPAINLRAELARIETRLANLAGTELANLRKSVSDSQARETDLRQRLRSAVLSSPLPASVLGEIFELQQGAELSRQQYQALLARIQDLDTQASLQVADSRIISPALPPENKAFPNTSLSLIAAAAFALALGAALAFLRENLIGGLLTEEQTEAVLKTRVAAVAPRARGEHGAPGGVADLMSSAPLSPFPEAVRRLKVAIDQHSGRLSARARTGDERSSGLVVMVSSSTASEGKSSIALSLARAFAVAHGRVAIIDADFRRPSIRQLAGLSRNDDFYDQLSSDRIDDEHFGAMPVDLDPLSSVTVIAGSSPSTRPTDHLITSRTFAALIDRMRSLYDIVVIDTPPIGPISDGLYLAAKSDVVVFVVRSGSTSQTEAKLALSSIRSVLPPGAAVVTVLNQQDQNSARYKQRYGDYYLSGTS